MTLMRPSSISLIAMAAIAGAAAASWIGRPGGAPMGEPIPLRASDVTVVDGDTIRVRGVLGGDRIRLTGYDTPEPHDPGCTREEELGRFAAASLEGMLGGAGRIELTLEAGRDAYGRGLGRLEVDGRDVGGRLARRRLARLDADGPHGSWCG